jgi:hypothetical protein
MLDRKGVNRSQCTKCECDEYKREKEFDLCAYCDYPPVVHGECPSSIQLFFIIT